MIEAITTCSGLRMQKAL